MHTFDSVPELLDSLIQEEVEAFRYGGQAEWATWFDKYLNVRFDELYLDKDHYNEVIARRNVIVHNDGRVSRQYRQRVGNDAPPIGTRLDVNPAYVAEAFEELTVFGLAAGAASWMKLSPDYGDYISAWYSAKVYHAMLARRWRTVIGLCRAGRAVATVDDEGSKILLFNEFVARKRLDGLDSVRAEIEATDVSALGPRFRVAWNALLDRNDEVARLLPMAMASEDLPNWALHQWPVLEDFRATQAYAELTLKLEPWRKELAAVDSKPVKLSRGAARPRKVKGVAH